jgi:hypothetical protein
MTETLAIRNADCLLTVTATYQAGQLDLRYHVQNSGELALYLCTHLYELAAGSPGSSPQLDSNLVMACGRWIFPTSRRYYPATPTSRRSACRCRYFPTACAAAGPVRRRQWPCRCGFR